MYKQTKLVFVDSSHVGNPARVSEDVNFSTRRVTRSQQQGATAAPKKYPLRQSRSSGSDTEQHGGDISERGMGKLYGPYFIPYHF